MLKKPTKNNTKIPKLKRQKQYQTNPRMSNAVIAGHMMTNCLKLAKRRELEEDPDAEKCQNCNTPGHDEESFYSGANMEIRPPRWTLTEAKKRLSKTKKKQAKKPKKNKKVERLQQSSCI